MPLKDQSRGNLPAHAIEGLHLFNAGKYFEAHEALELAWRAEKESIRELYQGILEAGVVYLHIQRGNYEGALKVFGRSMIWLRRFPSICRGVDVDGLRRDLSAVIAEVERLGPSRIGEFDQSMFKPVMWEA